MAQTSPSSGASFVMGKLFIMPSRMWSGIGAIRKVLEISPFLPPFLSHRAKHAKRSMNASPVNIHIEMKIVLVMCKAVQTELSELRSSHNLKGKAIWVIQHRHTKCPGSTNPMRQEKLLICACRGRTVVSMGPFLTSTYVLLMDCMM
jgi:hypothetical protein